MSLRWPLPHEHVKKLTTDTIWTDEHPDLASLEHLRARGDDIADNVVLHWRQHRNGTIFEAFHGAFCEQGGPSAPEAYAELHSKVTTVPAWVDWDLVAQGQAVFWRYWLPITQALLHCSLVGGYGAPKISAVLNSTGYLAGDAVMRRLAETTLFCIELMKDVASLQPGGRAWTHVVNVRLMHARVRVALTKKASSRTPDGGDVHANGGGDVHANGGNAATAAAGAYDPGDVKDASRYDRQRDGLAINQEDMIATLLSFSYIVIDGIQRIGIHMPPESVHAYLHLWRWVGWVIGVDPEYCPLKDGAERAQKWTDAIVVHLVHPDNNLSRQLAQHGLASSAAVSGAPLGYLHQVTRAMLCDEWVDAYHLQPSRWWWKWLLFIQVQFTRIAVALEGWVPGWARFRRTRARAAINVIVRSMLGSKASFDSGGDEGKHSGGSRCPMGFG